MALKLMYITNRPIIAEIAETSGVDRIFIDLEYIGKSERQGGMNTVKSNHQLSDIRQIADTVKKAEVLVRINPIHDMNLHQCSSQDEINMAIDNGAQILMLPYFKTLKEVETFIRLVDGRSKTLPLVETPEAVKIIDDILRLDGLDEIFIGLNDLSLGYNKKFMFELLCDGTVEDLAYKFRRSGIPFGFGGIASLGRGMLHSEKIIIEHYRLGSTSVILSRSFCDLNNTINIGEINSIFINGIREIREYENHINVHSKFFKDNQEDIKNEVARITGIM